MLTRRLHLAAGLVMLAYVACHLLNHALGAVVGLEALERARAILVGPWTTLPGTLLLAAAALAHIGIALTVTYRRRLLAMPTWQWTQLVLGLSIPFLLAEHAIATAGMRHLFGMEPSYVFVLAIFWKFAPVKGWTQLLLLVVAWSHASIGVHAWLRIRRWYGAWQPALFALAAALPLAATMGYVASGMRVRDLAADPVWVERMLADIGYPGRAGEIFAEGVTYSVWGVVAFAIAAVFAARAVRGWRVARGAGPRVTYPDGRRVPVPPGGTVLETSRSAGIPHASVCGGRGRCTTCRVRVVAGAEALPPPTALEAAALTRINAPPGVRLACQARPARDCAVEPLIPATVRPRERLRDRPTAQGREQEIVVLFSDLRGFTGFAEKKLPYDVVFLLNRYFAAMGQAIVGAGGRVDKFIGDGIMALFGVDDGPERGSAAALEAARRMAAALDELNRSLAAELGESLHMGIGIHAGPAIVGEMGYGEAAHVTAIGDTVNTASRLESMTKEERCQLIVSDTVAERAGRDLASFEARWVNVRGRSEPLCVRRIESALDLPAKS